MTLSAPAEHIADLLGDVENTVTPAIFPLDKRLAAQPGMYAWWGDEVACELLGEELGTALPSMLYVGQAGATNWPSGRRSAATLASRIGQQHIRGNARSSTFRLTISVLLMNRLGLVPGGGGKLDTRSNILVSKWLGEHLRVAIAPLDDRDAIGVVEREVVAYLDPPLNLGHCLPSTARARLTELRRALHRTGA